VTEWMRALAGRAGPLLPAARKFLHTHDPDFADDFDFSDDNELRTNRFFDYDKAVENYRVLADSERFAKSEDPDMDERRQGALINAAKILEYQQEYRRAAEYYQRAAEMLDSGNAREVSIQAEKMTTVIRLLNEEYFVAVALRPDGNYGKARFLLRTQGSKLLTELS